MLASESYYTIQMVNDQETESGLELVVASRSMYEENE